jgi:membrane protein implicated in regulation of membrane protease activity
MIGERAMVLTPMAAGGEGQVAVHGETWTARSSDALAVGDRVSVTAIDGLTVTVVRVTTMKETHPC